MKIMIIFPRTEQDLTHSLSLSGSRHKGRDNIIIETKQGLRPARYQETRSISLLSLKSWPQRPQTDTESALLPFRATFFLPQGPSPTLGWKPQNSSGIVTEDSQGSILLVRLWDKFCFQFQFRELISFNLKYRQYWNVCSNINGKTFFQECSILIDSMYHVT